MRLLQLIVPAAIALIGAYTLLVGIRDGVVRQRISSRLHRDGRELRGAWAVLHGAATTTVGVGIIAVAIWMSLELLRKVR